MDFHMKLPRRKREFILFLAIISIISVNIIAPLVTCFQIGFSFEAWANVVKVIPFVWLAVITLVLLTYKPAQWFTRKITRQGDSFHSTITINILCSVFMLSILLTIVGSWIGMRQVSLRPIEGFFYQWPRNFTIAFCVEALFAQPIARFVMHRYHKYIDAKTIVE